MYSFEPMRAINLGMDVWGGTTAVLRIKDPGEDSADEDESNAEEEVIPLSQEELDNAAHEVMGIMRARLDAKGYTGATIEREGDREIRVDLPMNETSPFLDADQIVKYLAEKGGISRSWMRTTMSS